MMAERKVFWSENSDPTTWGSALTENHLALINTARELLAVCKALYNDENIKRTSLPPELDFRIMCAIAKAEGKGVQ